MAGGGKPQNTAEAQPQVDLEGAFKYQICDAAAQPLQFGSLFTSSANTIGGATSKTTAKTSITSHDRVLIIFIRHFFCGFCQEYLQRLTNEPLLSAASLALHGLRITVIGCGAPSLIPSYRAVTGVPADWQIYTDPSTDLYRLLGMHRTLGMGNRRPKYVQRSMTSGMLGSILQGIKRISTGDVNGAGGLNINGGEFLFTFNEAEVKDQSKLDGWSLTWYHRMRNSRDHTEVDDLLKVLDVAPTTYATTAPTIRTKPAMHSRTHSIPLIVLEQDFIHTEKVDALRVVKRSSSFRRSLSVRQQSWMDKAGQLARSGSMKQRSMIVQPTHSTALAT